jgi:DNA-binding response OmpR family regulator
MSQTKEGFKKRILAVDDDIIVLTRITNILRNDYELVTVNSGMRALRYLREEKPDLILLDIRMAQQDGIETLREIRNMEERKDIPVIMLTGVENKDIVVESAKLGVCDYLLKPFSSTELLKRIQRVLGQEETEEDYESERRIME